MIAKRKKPSGHPENCSSGSPQTRAPLIASSLALRRQRRAAGAGSGERPGLWCPGDAGAPRPCRCPRAGRALSPAGGRPAPRQPSLRAAFPRDLRALPPAGSGRPAPASARRRSGMRAAAPGPDPLRAPAGEYGVGGVGGGKCRRERGGQTAAWTGGRVPAPLPRPGGDFCPVRALRACCGSFGRGAACRRGGPGSAAGRAPSSSAPSPRDASAARAVHGGAEAPDSGARRGPAGRCRRGGRCPAAPRRPRPGGPSPPRAAPARGATRRRESLRSGPGL